MTVAQHFSAGITFLRRVRPVRDDRHHRFGAHAATQKRMKRRLEIAPLYFRCVFFRSTFELRFLSFRILDRLSRLRHYSIRRSRSDCPCRLTMMTKELTKKWGIALLGWVIAIIFFLPNFLDDDHCFQDRERRLLL
jgi:hypothetical protein